ncbi:Putative white-brown complex homolog protein 30 [Seminavis robusta]|uniref:White-brown complex homolog protein 30 n=1 Tax=Seminavis robusta TaxID=568900 RepID=A0A9N8DAD2_9STRA|nr:Putative white-brown complex homolog protein 30 [Seminavis robusta]|eukprot:Sro14_g010700.1 Putative white-brown complex homolog protein 30 (748) ;mRNA; f:118274-120609
MAETSIATNGSSADNKRDDADPLIEAVDDDSQQNTTATTKAGGYYLRWSRLYKSVEIKESTAGLVRGPIAGPSSSTATKESGQATEASTPPTSLVHEQSRRSSWTLLSPASSMMMLGGGDNHNKNDNHKVILDRVSGCAAPGEVVGLMGPSGSGKTSLLNTLSGRSAYQEGTISINGEVLPNNNSAAAGSMKKLMSKIAYVKQADIFFQHLTVRDQFTYTALLRLPSKRMTTEEKVVEVDRIISLLRLGKVANSPIKMLSGGEKKRVNIGTELLTNPSILLLDEPTSGLDSTSAVSLLQLLHRLAKGDGTAPPKTVITSIHQPSSAVFRAFDRLLLLSDGKVVYFGNPVASLDYLRTQNLACPDGYNAADHWMDVLVIDDSPHDNNNHNTTTSDDDEDEQQGLLPPKTIPRLQLQQAWDNEAVAEQMDAAIEDIGSTNKSGSSVNSLLLDGVDNNGSSGNKYSTSWATQYWVLTHRCMKNSRSAIFTPLNLIKSVCIGLVAGMLWFQLPYTEERVHDRSSYYFFTMTFWVFDSMMGALMAFPAERAVILKERASGSYHLSAYFLAKTTSDAPVRLTLPFLYMVTSYWMAGIDNRFWVFVSSTCCTLLSVVSGEALGLLVGTSIHDMTKALTVMIVSGLFLMLLGGFYVQNIPSFISWVKWFSPFKYAFSASLQLVFQDDVPCDGSGNLEDLCGGGNDYGFAKGSDVVAYLGAEGSIGFNVGMLLVICFVPRYGAYLALRAQKGGERS